MGKIKSVSEYFDKMHERFVPDQAVGVNAVFQYELEGATGGAWYLRVVDGVLTEVNRGVVEKPTLTIHMEAQNFVEMANGDLDGAKAFLTRKLKVKGNIAMAQKMKKFIPPANA